MSSSTSGRAARVARGGGGSGAGGGEEVGEGVEEFTHLIPPDFLLKQTPLSKISEEYGVVEYQLQLALRSPSCEVENIWFISNPHVTLQFEKRTNGHLILDSWMDTSRLTEHNTIPDLCQRGFKFPVSVGNISIKSPKIPGQSHSLKDDPTVMNSSRPSLPEGYDSLYLHKSDDQMREDTKGKPPAYYHEYLLLDPAQVLPMFLVQFKYDPDEDETKKVPLCDVCEENIAAVYCRQDAARLCEDCDEEVHSANKLVSKHMRVPLYEQPQAFGTCPIHTQLTVEFFCPICQTPVCVHCKMVGNHSTGEAASHKLIAIGDAYRGALGGADKDDPIMEGRRQAIMTQLTLIDERLKEVNRNSGEIESKIYQILREALFQLQQETQKKLAILLGDELELRRQLEQIEWLENFLRFQVQVLPPVKFLSAWSRHSKLRGEWLAAQHIRGQIDVSPDIRLRALVEVVTEQTLIKREEDQQDDAWQQEELSRGFGAMSPQKLPVFGKSPSSSTPPPNRLNSGLDDSQNSYTAKRTADIWRDELRKRHLGGTGPLGVGTVDAPPPQPKNEEAERKQYQLHQLGINPSSINPFANSRVLTPDQGSILYFCLPFTNTPGTRLMFASYHDGSSISILHQKCDSIGPTVVIARSGDHVFGGYASTSWNASKMPFGTGKSFVYSITRDTKVTYSGARDTCCLFGTPSSISWGHVDLVLKDDLKYCTSDLENSYGIGLPYQSVEAQSLLAGDHHFEINCLEVWAFTK